LTKKTNPKNEPAGEFVKPDQDVGTPFEDAVRRLLQTPPIKKSKPQEKKDI
jgi:hypothetical protein